MNVDYPLINLTDDLNDTRSKLLLLRGVHFNELEDDAGVALHKMLVEVGDVIDKVLAVIGEQQ
jgi:hypothetical protein